MNNRSRSEHVRDVLGGPDGGREYAQLKQCVGKRGGHSKVDPAKDGEDRYHDELVGLLEDARPSKVGLAIHITVTVGQAVIEDARARKVRKFSDSSDEDIAVSASTNPAFDTELQYLNRALSEEMTEWLPQALAKCTPAERAAFCEWLENGMEYPAGWPAGMGRRKACQRALEKLGELASPELVYRFRAFQQHVN